MHGPAGCFVVFTHIKPNNSHTRHVQQIRQRWGVSRVAMEHRLGSCPVGEASVAIAVSSPHRREALEAAHYAIDAIKANVPIWKKVTCRDLGFPGFFDDMLD